MKVGPTERILLGSDAPLAPALSGVSAPGTLVALPAPAPFFAAPGPGFDGACDILLARSSVTMISPWSSEALSSMFFRASDQVCPAALQAQDGLNSVR